MKRMDSAQILSSLKSTDEKSRMVAKMHLFMHEFNRQDVPAIFNALEFKYFDDNESSQSIRELLFNTIGKLNDDRTKNFVRRIYPALPKNSGILTSALASVSEEKTPEAEKTVFFMLRDYHKDVAIHIDLIFESFRDRAELINPIISDLAVLLENPNLKPSIYRLFGNWLDEGIVKSEDMKIVQRYIYSDATELAKMLTDPKILTQAISKNEGPLADKLPMIDSIAALLGFIPIGDILKMLHRWFFPMPDK